ncbi:glycosyl hydrolase family protein [Halobacteriovorax vibrionivorans]|uniref:Beta-amylase n=1 Tax=Halobacteriovorax vibrionivorans TaxID=2152716 RepID=A0ABY0IH57_9BACT|nr:family 14 glycosylhydrolase [Halobacteriovorax vibrionivorans]RZF22281.1 glycosyl hydrolase family protein [Halobacteriovorax vibrionivorans]
MKSKALLSLFLTLYCLTTSAKVFNVMAPLVIGDPNNLSSEYSKAELRKFQDQLNEIKSLGATGVSTDIWWGLIEKEDNKFNWQYYQVLSDLIIDAGLKWVPILSFHKCGGNVGDTCDVPIPNWLWQKYGTSAMSKSEQGNFSKEYLSVWSTHKAINEFYEVMGSFKMNFSHKMKDIYEINVSLGPAGELRYPSYNSHDNGSGYPTRGALQAYSELAIESFRNYVRNKYSNIDTVNFMWGFNLSSFKEVAPPNPFFFFPAQEQHTNYGKDFYNWYSKSLREHGKRILGAAIDTFRSEAHIQLGFKVPGIHWRVAPGADRLAELNAGLISTDQDIFSDKTGHGYNRIIGIINELRKEKDFHQLNFHFTCLEMNNLEGPTNAQSYAKALVFWVAQEAQKQGVRILGENALAGTLHDHKAWDNIADALYFGNYDGVTFLRMGTILSSQLAKDRFRQMTKQ